MKRVVLTGLTVAVFASPGWAGMSCSLVDQQNNMLQYSFARGGSGFTNETLVKRNGATVSEGGPAWNRAYNRADRTVTLAQAGWRLVYEAKASLSDAAGAALFHDADQIAAGTCVADLSIDASREI